MTERTFRAVGRQHADNWESLERSAETFTNEHVVKWLAANDPALKQAITQQRRRKLSANAGWLRLLESERDQRARWVAVTHPEESRMPISPELAEGLNELTRELDDRLNDHLVIGASVDPLVLAGRIVGLLSAAEVLLALVPSNEVAAFCVYLATLISDAT